MREFQDKRKRRKALYSPLVLVILFVSLVIMIKAAWGAYLKYSESEEKLALSSLERDKLGNRRKRLSAQISRLETDRGIEEEIRNTFRVAKEGERLIVILDTPKEADNNTVVKKHWWSFFVDIFE